MRNSYRKQKQAYSEIALILSCDIAYANENGKYLLGTNQLFPIYDYSFLNGGLHNVQMYLYSALTWRGLYYTDMGHAVHPEEEPDATLGYGCGIHIFNYMNGSPCLAKARHGHDLQIKDWLNLHHNSTAVPIQHLLPKIWQKAEGGQQFWTPTEGIISAVPVDIPMVFDTSHEFSRRIRYRLGGDTLASKVTAMLYEYMRDNHVDRLYIGYDADPTKATETWLVDAYQWSHNHSRRISAMKRDDNYFYGYLGHRNARMLSQHINNGKFSNEKVFT